MRKELLLRLACILPAIQLSAQPDSLMLNEVVVKAMPFSEFAGASKVIEIDSLQLISFGDQNIGQSLAQVTPIYIRSYGHGMASGISIRGTGPNHTAVFWNGLNINSRTLGQSDVSLLPTFLTDKVEVQFGGSSSLFGTDAIGGSVHLLTELPLAEGFNIMATQQVGSFGVFQSGLKGSYSNRNLSFRSTLYRTEVENDFTYNVPSKGAEIRQDNASMRYQGFQQDFRWKVNDTKSIELNTWFHESDREIQPTIEGSGDDYMMDESLKIALAFRHGSPSIAYTLRAGHLNDIQVYNGASELSTKQFLLNANVEKSVGNWLISAGVNGNHIFVENTNYARGEEEMRTDLFLLSRYRKGKITVTGNLRQNYVSDITTSFTPSLSLQYWVLPELQLTGQLSRNLRVPTLNDRYWSPGGKPNLRPELSNSAEIGIQYIKHNFELRANIYKMWIDQWIIWLRDSGGWSPENIKEVESGGVELNTEYHINLKNGAVYMGGGYAYTKSVSTKPMSDTDFTVGRQLPYTPIHKIFANLKLIKSGWFVNLSSQYTGERNALGSDNLSPYILMDFAVGGQRSFPFGRLGLRGTIKNFTDETYQSLLNYAMPGRNFSITLTYTLK